MNTMVKGYFESLGVCPDEDEYALGECIQLLYRGCVRVNRPMVAVIYSERMRKLVRGWLEDDSR